MKTAPISYDYTRPLKFVRVRISENKPWVSAPVHPIPGEPVDG
jgi:hypothetical protein